MPILRQSVFVIAALIILFSVFTVSAQDSHEASINLDASDLEPVMHRVRALCEQGISDERIKEVVSVPADFAREFVDDSTQWTLDVVCGGQTAQLRIEVVMDDIDAPDIYFYSDNEKVTNAIQETLIAYMEEQGR